MNDYIAGFFVNIKSRASPNYIYFHGSNYKFAKPWEGGGRVGVPY